MRPHPFRRATDDVAATPRWTLEEADLIRRAQGDADLERILRAAAGTEPADLQAFRTQALLPLAHARMVIGGASVLPMLERQLALAFIDKAVRIIELFEPETGA